MAKRNLDKILDQFAREYMKLDYVQGVEMSFVERYDPTSDKPNDFCLVAFVSDPSPIDLEIPSEYKGLRVFTQKAGKIELTAK